MAVTTKKAKDQTKNQEVSTSAEDRSTIYLPDRDAKIAEIAYHKAESRDFTPGYELEDWLEAEREFLL
ncbi:MAG: DUF2934 domain-containing protein [Methylobacter sp.]|nr:DUF2934 domain-containing protein [Methylobacter sp.]